MDDPSQNKVDMSLDDIIKLNKKEKRQAKKTKMAVGRGRGQTRGRGQGQLRGVGRGMRGALAAGRGRQGGALGARGRGQRGALRGGAFSGRGRAKNVLNKAPPTTVQAGYRSSMRGVNLSTIPRRGRGRGRARGLGLAQKSQTGIGGVRKQTTVVQTGKNLRGIGRGRGNRRGVLANKGKQPMVFTNSAKRQERPQQLFTVKQQSSLLMEKEVAVKNLQQAKRNVQTINKAIQQTSRDQVVNQRRGINTNGTQAAGRGRRKLLAGLMSPKSASASNLNLSAGPARHMVNTSVTISNPRAASGNRRRQWRPKTSNVVLQVGNPGSYSSPAPKPSFTDQLKNLKPSQPTTYKFQKNIFAAPSTSVSLNDRFSSHRGSESALEGRKVFV